MLTLLWKSSKSSSRPPWNTMGVLLFLKIIFCTKKKKDKENRENIFYSIYLFHLFIYSIYLFIYSIYLINYLFIYTIYLFIHLFIYLFIPFIPYISFIYLFIYLLIYLLTYLFIYLFIPFIYIFIYSIYFFIYLFHLFIYLFHLFIYLFTVLKKYKEHKINKLEEKNIFHFSENTKKYSLHFQNHEPKSPYKYISHSCL